MAEPTTASSSLADLSNRIAELETNSWNIPPKLLPDLQPTLTPTALSQMSRARSAVIGANCTSAVWKFVPSDYYTYDLEKRRQTLGASNSFQLTKSVLFENIKCDATDCSDRTNSRYYLVVVQYEAEINGKKLASEIRALRPAVKDRLPPNKFEFRLASSGDNDKLTGYGHNSVTPFGLLEDVPVLMASAIRDVKPAFVFMGGGHVDLKLGMAVEDFVQGANAIVADVSDPRSGAFKEE